MLVISTIRLLRNAVPDEMQAVIASLKECSCNILWQSIKCTQGCLCEYLFLQSDSGPCSMNKNLRSVLSQDGNLTDH